MHPLSLSLPIHIETMFSITGRRAALKQPRCALTKPARAIAAQVSAASQRDFHATPKNAVTRPTWMPMRVKTPWIDALTASREAARNAKEGGPAPKLVKPDLTPKRMSDSYYSAVCMDSFFGR